MVKGRNDSNCPVCTAPLRNVHVTERTRFACTGLSRLITLIVVGALVVLGCAMHTLAEAAREPNANDRLTLLTAGCVMLLLFGITTGVLGAYVCRQGLWGLCKIFVTRERHVRVANHADDLP